MAIEQITTDGIDGTPSDGGNSKTPRLFHERADLGVCFDAIAKLAVIACEAGEDHFRRDAVLWAIEKLAKAGANEAELVVN